MFQHVLIPLDGSRLAEAVLPVIATLARVLDCPVTLLHVIERGAPATVHGERHLRDVAEAERYLDGVAGGLSALGLHVDHHCHEAGVADVARSIVDHATEIDADLVAICTHGRGGLGATLTGSIAQQVLRGGAAAVLIVRPTADGRAPAFAPRLVLTPLDGGPEGEHALMPTADLAGRLGATVRLVRIVATQTTVRGDLAATARLLPVATMAMLDLETDEARRYLAEWIERLARQGVAATAEVRRGDVVDELTAAATTADLLVMATRGQVGIGALWSGSVAPRLVARLRCPAVLLRAPAP